MSKLTAAQCRARSLAYEEVAEHLGLSWTDDPLEREQGDIIARALHSQATHWAQLGFKRDIEEQAAKKK